MFSGNVRQLMFLPCPDSRRLRARRMLQRCEPCHQQVKHVNNRSVHILQRVKGREKQGKENEEATEEQVILSASSSNVELAGGKLVFATVL